MRFAYGVGKRVLKWLAIFVAVMLAWRMAIGIESIPSSLDAMVGSGSHQTAQFFGGNTR